ncbi:MAG: glycerol-3-phosphate 1-O-acyltransferase PlsY [Rhodobacteraceae bacterium]|nr:glycerol-3-phosphate 1-O-acyltransferase PlsY [Paracoccaceae bacterium]
MPALESPLVVLVIWAAIGYLLGAVPFGLILSRLFGLGDLRQIGSGNIGATNVLRTGNKLAAALTLLLDGGKGAVAVLLARTWAGEGAVQLAALAAMLGHCFPAWLGFRGGKGVATFLGIWLVLAWPVGVACCLTWLFLVGINRMSSMGAMGTAAFSTVWMLVLGSGSTLILGFVLTALVVVRHKDNIARIRAGTEPKIGQNS